MYLYDNSYKNISGTEKIIINTELQAIKPKMYKKLVGNKYSNKFCLEIFFLTLMSIVWTLLRQSSSAKITVYNL